jgi:hypothetical protein
MRQGPPDEATCRKCHTPGQDKNFDFEKSQNWFTPIKCFTFDRLCYGNRICGELAAYFVSADDRGIG